MPAKEKYNIIKLVHQSTILLIFSCQCYQWKQKEALTQKENICQCVMNNTYSDKETNANTWQQWLARSHGQGRGKRAVRGDISAAVLLQNWIHSERIFFRIMIVLKKIKL